MSLPAHYQGLPAAEKQELLWRKIEASPYAADALPDIGDAQFYMHAFAGGLLSVDYLRDSFLRAGDEMAPGRTKILHTYGAVARVALEPRSGHPFTGIWRSGAIGLARLSVAFPDHGKFCPGIALKFLIDGKPSVNQFAMPTLLGQAGNENAFARTYTNPFPKDSLGLPLALLKAIFAHTAESFRSESLHNNHLPFDESSSIERDGQAVAAPVVAWGMRLEPVPETQIPAERGPDYRIKLAALAPGSLLFRVHLQAAAETPYYHVGDLRLTGHFLASKWGDEGLFFQHPAGRTGASVAPPDLERRHAVSVENKAIIHRWMDEFWTKANIPIADEMTTPDFVMYYPLTGELKGRETVKQVIGAFYKAFPGATFSLIGDLIAEGDKVVGRWRGQGTQTGAFGPIPATGKFATWTGTNIWKIVDGKIAEEIGEEDALSFLQQLGLVPKVG